MLVTAGAVRLRGDLLHKSSAVRPLYLATAAESTLTAVGEFLRALGWSLIWMRQR